MDCDSKKMGPREIQEKKPSSIRNKEIRTRVRWDLNPRPQPITLANPARVDEITSSFLA
jgi:hypothetical protein